MLVLFFKYVFKLKALGQKPSHFQSSHFQYWHFMASETDLITKKFLFFNIKMAVYFIQLYLFL